jgi:hypothetical protein
MTLFIKFSFIITLKSTLHVNVRAISLTEPFPVRKIDKRPDLRIAVGSY